MQALQILCSKKGPEKRFHESVESGQSPFIKRKDGRPRSRVQKEQG